MEKTDKKEKEMPHQEYELKRQAEAKQATDEELGTLARKIVNAAWDKGRDFTEAEQIALGVYEDEATRRGLNFVALVHEQ